MSDDLDERKEPDYNTLTARRVQVEERCPIASLRLREMWGERSSCREGVWLQDQTSCHVCLMDTEDGYSPRLLRSSREQHSTPRRSDDTAHRATCSNTPYGNESSVVSFTWSSGEYNDDGGSTDGDMKGFSSEACKWDALATRNSPVFEWGSLDYGPPVR